MNSGLKWIAQKRRESVIRPAVKEAVKQALSSNDIRRLLEAELNNISDPFSDVVSDVGGWVEDYSESEGWVVFYRDGKQFRADFAIEGANVSIDRDSISEVISRQVYEEVDGD